MFSFCFVNIILQKTVKTFFNQNFSIREHFRGSWAPRKTIWDPLVYMLVKSGAGVWITHSNKHDGGRTQSYRKRVVACQKCVLHSWQPPRKNMRWFPLLFTSVCCNHWHRQQALSVPHFLISCLCFYWTVYRRATK